MRILRLFLAVTIFSISFLSISPAQASFQNGIPVLLYHHVSDGATDLPKLTVSNEVFDSQMKKLSQAGFQTITVDDLISYMSGKKTALPDKPILISFDDGYDDNYYNAFPILKKYGFKAVVFMVGVNIDAPRRLSSEQMRKMSEYGLEFGAHSVTHRDMTLLSPQDLHKETRDSKTAIEKVIHQKVRLFAYPYGTYNLPVWKDLDSAGYEGALTTLSGPVKYGNDNIYLMRRIYILRNTDFDTLFEKLDANRPKEFLLEYAPEFHEDDEDEN